MWVHCLSTRLLTSCYQRDTLMCNEAVTVCLTSSQVTLEDTVITQRPHVTASAVSVNLDTIFNITWPSFYRNCRSKWWISSDGIVREDLSKICVGNDMVAKEASIWYFPRDRKLVAVRRPYGGNLGLGWFAAATANTKRLTVSHHYSSLLLELVRFGDCIASGG